MESSVIFSSTQDRLCSLHPMGHKDVPLLAGWTSSMLPLASRAFSLCGSTMVVKKDNLSPHWIEGMSRKN